MAITTMDGLVAALATAQTSQITMLSVTNAAGGWIGTNFGATGDSMGTLATPTAASSGGQVYNNNSSPQQGFPSWTAHGTGKTTYLGATNMTAAQIGTWHVYDVLWACSGFSGTVTTAQAVTSMPALPSRNSTGNGAELWTCNYVAIGGTGQTLTVSYTNQSGTAGQTTVGTTTIAPQYRMQRLPLAAGDTGIQAVASCTLGGSTGSAGNFGLLIMQRIVSIPIPTANTAQQLDFAGLGLPVVDDNASLLFVQQATTTSSGLMMATLSIIQG